MSDATASVVETAAEVVKSLIEKIVKRDASVKTYNGSPLPNGPIDFDYEFPELQKGSIIPQNELPDEDDIRNWVNTKRASAARAKKQAEVLEAAGIQKPTLEDPEFRLKQMVKLLIAAKMDPETAEQTARTTLGM